MHSGSDQGEIATAGANDRAAYEALVASHYRQVFAVCLGMLSSIHDAEDAAQETMLKGLANMPNHSDGHGLRAWILRIAKNLCVDLLRKRNRPRPPAHEPAVQLRQDVNALYDMEQALQRLPMELRVPLMMYYFDGRNAASVAESLNISHATACQRLRMARRQLHEFMTERTAQ